MHYVSFLFPLVLLILIRKSFAQPLTCTAGKCNVKCTDETIILGNESYGWENLQFAYNQTCVYKFIIPKNTYVNVDFSHIFFDECYFEITDSTNVLYRTEEANTVESWYGRGKIVRSISPIIYFKLYMNETNGYTLDAPLFYSFRIWVIPIPYSSAVIHDLRKSPALIDMSKLGSNDDLGVINFITSTTIEMYFACQEFGAWYGLDMFILANGTKPGGPVLGTMASHMGYSTFPGNISLIYQYINTICLMVVMEISENRYKNFSLQYLEGEEYSLNLTADAVPAAVLVVDPVFLFPFQLAEYSSLYVYDGLPPNDMSSPVFTFLPGNEPKTPFDLTGKSFRTVVLYNATISLPLRRWFDFDRFCGQYNFSGKETESQLYFRSDSDKDYLFNLTLIGDNETCPTCPTTRILNQTFFFEWIPANGFLTVDIQCAAAICIPLLPLVLYVLIHAVQ